MIAASVALVHRERFAAEMQKSHVTSSVLDSRGGWTPWIREPYSGAWQRNDEWSVDTVLAHHAVYTCVTLIASDIGKLRARLVAESRDGIWEETTSPTFSRVLRKPNRFQNHIQFKEAWMHSKLIRGNTYVLKERDNRGGEFQGSVRALYILDPSRVQVLVAPDGSVFYALQADNLSSIEHANTVPASEIIHDRINCLFHPLVGVSPIFASGAAANVGLKIETNATGFFGNGSNPSGALTVPTSISQADADRISDRWNQAYSGRNSGLVPVLPNGMTFTPIRMSAVDSQMIEHLRWTAETVASTFHVPAFKIGVGDMPTYNNGELLDQKYYSDCLQFHIESWEACMDEGLGLDSAKEGGRMLGVELDLDGLLRMDTATQVKTLTEGVRGAIYAPNEARRAVNLKPVKGGDTPFLQHQDYPIHLLADRDPPKEAGATGGAPSPPPEPSSEKVSDMLAFKAKHKARVARLKTPAVVTEERVA